MLRTRFDKLAKRLLGAILPSAGTVTTQHNVAALDDQAVDTWFVPTAGLEPELERLGVVGRMARGPSMFEAFHEPPSIKDYRDCVRKQLTLDHARVLDADKLSQEAPLFPRLWILSAGRAESVLLLYGFAPMLEFPKGFHERAVGDLIGLVVLRELPVSRETLFLRLMASGEVLRVAIAEIERLPEDAWERRVALPILVALRFEIPQDGRTDEEEAFLMSTTALYEHWRQYYEDEGLKKGEERGLKKGEERGLKKGEERGMKEALVEFYEARFGTMPPSLLSAIEAVHDVATLKSWTRLAATSSAEEIAAAVQAAKKLPG